ncbi:hypothetical protein [Ottowia testudinis]|uniref:Uncharacterized protein n=1 Tax=Ottowia testudinis TaxID=2816950 RepID=A0A975CEE5_9BURK|nr:hypothetical protein [Ottowia testudinis]QTD44307.1 hypothetical protein J1M35_14460 [Ottowia testudinis]
MTKSNAHIVAGPFALVSSGNCTQSWMVDGADIQERANAALDPYWGKGPVMIHDRGVTGYGIQVEGSPYVVCVYGTREIAERKLAEALAS